MKNRLSIEERNQVLQSMSHLIDERSEELLQENEKDMSSFDQNDIAMYDRLKVDHDKVNGMKASLEQLASQADPLNHERFRFNHENGLEIINKTAPFGTVLIIYESRPDVTIEAAGIAFKSGNRILLKGGKEALNSNLFLVKLWHEALEMNGIDTSWVSYLNYDRSRTQEFLKRPDQPLDLIIPRGGERLIAFVKEHAQCPVIVSGRGNNFAYVAADADIDMALSIITNAKVAKISACNALDKVLIDQDHPELDTLFLKLTNELKEHQVKILRAPELPEVAGTDLLTAEEVWYEEFLDYKIVIGSVKGLDQAISKINKYGGGHSATIVSADTDKATLFQDAIDAAAVYHNASTRFTDGFQFGLGGELAISTDKLHQRGPIGLNHLVTNKWYVHGKGQIR